MPNHVPLVLTPHTADGVARAIGETHRQYIGFFNARSRWTGHLFQDRFSSVALDEAHLMAAARDVALNRVRARLVAQAQDWAWSNAPAHLAGQDDGWCGLRRCSIGSALRRPDRRRARLLSFHGTCATRKAARSDAGAAHRASAATRQPGRKPSAAEAEQLELGIGEMG
jgi:hypothetical protein